MFCGQYYKLYTQSLFLFLSADSGKGTSTGSSRPSSQVISVETEEGVRPGRSWSVGKNNTLSPLTDQVAPAPSETGEGRRNQRTEKGTIGKHCICTHSLLLSPSITYSVTICNVHMCVMFGIAREWQQAAE